MTRFLIDLISGNFIHNKLAVVEMKLGTEYMAIHGLNQWWPSFMRYILTRPAVNIAVNKIDI